MSEYQANQELKAGASNNASRNRARRSTDTDYPAARFIFRALVVAVILSALLSFGGAL